MSWFDKLCDLYVQYVSYVHDDIASEYLRFDKTLFIRAKYYNANLITTDLYYFDIKNAGPSLVRYIDENLYQRVLREQDKIERSKLISTSLSSDQYKWLNSAMKMLIMLRAIAQYDIVEVYELKKDSILFKGEERVPVTELVEFCNEFEFHSDVYHLYAYVNDTSYYYTKDIKVKGKYKYLPPYTKSILRNWFSQPAIVFNKDAVREQLRPYMHETGVLDHDLYVENGLVLNRSLTYTRNLTEVFPRAYLYVHFYPLASLLKKL